jgi:hypothetical protein
MIAKRNIFGYLTEIGNFVTRIFEHENRSQSMADPDSPDFSDEFNKASDINHKIHLLYSSLEYGDKIEGNRYLNNADKEYLSQFHNNEQKRQELVELKKQFYKIKWPN